MSADVHDKIVFKEERNLYRYSEGYLNFSATSYDDEYAYNKKKISRDPMSHRIIEKRRRDRMNNCLADLSRLIPPEYLKKGRGRIEKTEIIEMAIKHMRHLQSIIASTRFNENSNSSAPSPPAAQSLARDIPTLQKSADHPNILKHYKMGYLECISEAMHFLVEVQGYFAGDSLCVQMINHLHKHCDNILKGNSLNFLKKSLRETTYSDSSTSPINVMYNNSPPSGLSNSFDSSSDENPRNQMFDLRGLENGKMDPGFYSVKKYPDSFYTSDKHSDVCYSRHPDGTENENLSDSELHYQSIYKCRNNDVRRDESNNNMDAFGNHQKNNEIYNNMEESGNGLSQLKEMLTSPSSVNLQIKDHSKKVFEPKGDVSPLSNTSGYETSSGTTTQTCIKTSPSKRVDPGQTDLSDGENHYLMYKFKNNIQQRFSKENEENVESITTENLQQLKKPKPEECQKYRELTVRPMERMDIEEERLFKFNADFEHRKKIRYGSESDNQEDGIASRLNFGHKSEKVKKSEKTTSYQIQNNPKQWVLSPNPSVPFFTSSGELKPFLRESSEYSTTINNSYHNLSLPPPEPGQGVPIFALHAKGSFYIPLTLDQTVLAPFLTVLGIAKTDEVLPEKTVLHPVTISVNFQPHFVQ